MPSKPKAPSKITNADLLGSVEYLGGHLATTLESVVKALEALDRRVSEQATVQHQPGAMDAERLMKLARAQLDRDLYPTPPKSDRDFGYAEVAMGSKPATVQDKLAFLLDRLLQVHGALDGIAPGQNMAGVPQPGMTPPGQEGIDYYLNRLETEVFGLMERSSELARRVGRL